MHASRIWALALAIQVALALVGCDGLIGDGPAGPTGYVDRTPPPPEPLVPAPPMLHRLVRHEYEQTIRELFPPGTTVPTDLPDDTWRHGFSTVGASELTISPREVEQYEAAANDLVAQTLGDPGRRAAFFGCDAAAEGEACTRAFVTRFGRLAWRRPLTAAEIDQLTAVATDTGGLLRDPWRGIGFAASTILQSPHFLFRVEIGEPDPADGERLRFTSIEMASRLSYFIWGGPPDAELLRAGEAGELVTDAGLRTQVDRMTLDARAAASMARFFYEFMSLDRLATVSKDPTMFPEFTDSMRASMRAEVELLFADVYTRDADVREIFSTDVTFVDSELAALYGLPDPGPGMRARTTLPASQQRGGVMGRAGILAMWSHATLTSPTLRGKFIRTNLLCQDIMPPPPGISTEIPPAMGTETLRMRMDRHRTDPVCAGCHVMMDPLGFTLEHYDPIGRFRTEDNTLPIDATGDVDGLPVDGAEELGDALAASPRVGSCFARRFYRWGTGHLETPGEQPEIQRIQTEFASAGYGMRALIRLLVLSPAFRTATYPEGDCTSGETRDCTNACGAGTQTCEHNAWRACSAPSGGIETCNGGDDDCDGTADEGISRPCTSACGAGIEMCVAGGYGACSARTPGAEVCNHADDDCDGTVDDGFGAMSFGATYTGLRGIHPVCDGTTQRMGLECNAAIHGFCATSASTCGTSGFGPVENSGDTAVIGCVTASLHTVTWGELAARHDGCNGTTQRVGPECNAAIHRWCGANGETTGFGPVGASGADVVIACVPGAETAGVTYGAMSARHGGCTQANPYGQDCNAAIHRECTARGAASGWGPLEHSGDNLQIACVRP